MWVVKIKKKLKSAGFAAKVDRFEIQTGIDLLGVDQTEHIQFIIDEQGKLVKAVQSSAIPPSKPEGTAATPPSETVDIEGVVVAGYRPLKNQEQDYEEEDIQLLVNEAIRVITASELEWKPAMKNGKAVKSAWTMPIAFSL